MKEPLTSWRNLFEGGVPINRGSTKLANCPFFITNIFIFTFQSIVLHLLQCRATFYQVNVERLSEINKLCWALLKWRYALRNRTAQVRQRRDASKKTLRNHTRSKSAKRVPRPGPSSIKFTFSGCPICSHRHIAHTPISWGKAAKHYLLLSH